MLKSRSIGSGTLVTKLQPGIVLLLGEVEEFFSHPVNRLFVQGNRQDLTGFIDGRLKDSLVMFHIDWLVIILANMVVGEQ